MIRVAISVEGDTEVECIKLLIEKHLRMREIEPTPISLQGNVSVDRLAQDMVRLLPSFDAVTSLVDFYEFRKKGNKTVDELEEELTRRIKAEKAFPYIQRYEFEGLLFSKK